MGPRPFQPKRKTRTVALFGEAEKGEFQRAYFCQNLEQLLERLGNPPPDSQGLYYAVQSLLYGCQLVFFRVSEEGFSTEDYLLGLHMLRNSDAIPPLSALCLPGVGDANIICATSPICNQHKSILVVSEHDLYDYLTAYPRSRVD